MDRFPRIFFAQCREGRSRDPRNSKRPVILFSPLWNVLDSWEASTAVCLRNGQMHMAAFVVHALACPSTPNTLKGGQQTGSSWEVSTIPESRLGARTRKRRQAGRTPNVPRSRGTLKTVRPRLECAELAPAFATSPPAGSNWRKLVGQAASLSLWASCPWTKLRLEAPLTGRMPVPGVWTFWRTKK